MSEKVLIIAEAGVNHNGSLELAKKLVDEAVRAGADIVKFQTFIAKKAISKYAPKANYQDINEPNSLSQLEMVEKLELSFDAFIDLAKYCNVKGIEFLSTPFDFESIDFLATLDMKRWKIPSGEITNLPYLKKIAKFNKPIILSTGMSTMEEISQAVQVLRENGANDISLLHCTTEYPAPFEEVNLSAMKSMSDIFNLPIGYSDHTKGIEVTIAAVALGARIIEKHFTLDRSMEGPDHIASIDAKMLKLMVESIRNVECSIGDGIKTPTESEMMNRTVARKSIVATTHISQGELFTEKNIGVKRPGSGLSPMLWDQVIGQRALKNFEEDEMITL